MTIEEADRKGWADLGSGDDDPGSDDGDSNRPPSIQLKERKTGGSVWERFRKWWNGGWKQRRMEGRGFIPEGTYSPEEIVSLYLLYKLDHAIMIATREGLIDQPTAENFRNAIGDAKMQLLPKTLGGGSKENIEDNDILWGQIGTGAINVLGGLCEGVADLSIAWFAGQAKGLVMY